MPDSGRVDRECVFNRIYRDCYVNKIIIVIDAFIIKAAMEGSDFIVAEWIE